MKEDFIKKSKLKHNDKYDYSKVNYINSRTKVCVICPKHGEFWMTPANHVFGYGCPKCKNENTGNRKRLTLKEFVEKAKEKHGNKYDYSKVNYRDYNTKVCIICTEHGEFWQTPNNHIKGQGCPKCAVNRSLSTNDFITKAKKIHNNEYDYSKVEYVNSYTKIEIICYKHGSFYQTPFLHLRGCGCPKCGTEKAHIKQKSNNDEFIKKANAIHNGKYDYSNIHYINNKTKIEIICPKHGSFWQTPYHHLQGHGCPKCKEENIKQLRTLTQTEFLERVNKLYGNKYDCSHVKYVNYNSKININCPVHGIFTKRTSNFLNGQGCPLCNKENYRQKRAFTNCEFIQKAREIHGDKYDYSKVEYVNNHTDICIVCPKHGEFWQSTDKHLSGHGCPKCGISYSKAEEEIKNFVENDCGFITLKNKRDIITPYEIDIYIPDKKIGIEYDGLIWHSNKFDVNKEYHLAKTNLCENKGIQLVHIFENEWLEHKEIVKSKLRQLLNNNIIPKPNIKNCEIREIKYSIAKEFVLSNDIQRFSKSTVHIGCYLDNNIIGFLSAKKHKNNIWKINNIVILNNYQQVEIQKCLFSYFVRKYNPKQITGYLDRRWYSILNCNIYDILGFARDGVSKPYYYFVDRSRLIFKNQKINKKLKLPKIWDCGGIKYLYVNNNFKE